MHLRMLSAHVHHCVEEGQLRLIASILGLDSAVIGKCRSIESDLLACSIGPNSIYVPVGQSRSLNFWAAFWDFIGRLKQIGQPAISICSLKNENHQELLIVESKCLIGVVLIPILANSMPVEFQRAYPQLPEAQKQTSILSFYQVVSSTQIDQIILTCGSVRRHFVIQPISLTGDIMDLWTSSLQKQLTFASIDISLDELLSLRPGDVIQVSSKYVSMPCYLGSSGSEVFERQVVVRADLKIQIQSVVPPQHFTLLPEGMGSFVTTENENDGE
jgi:hypothetical protein